MTDTEQRFALSMRQVDDDEPGLIRERDGTVWVVNPDGTRTQLPGSGSGVPDGGSTGEVLTKASNADGDAVWEPSGGSQSGAVRWLGPCKTNAWAGQYVSANPSDVTGGSFRLSLGGQQTAPIAWDASEAAVVAALEAVVGVGSVGLNPLSTGGPDIDSGYYVLFDELTATELMTGDFTGLTGPSAPYAADVTASEFMVEMFTPAVGDIIEDFFHVVVESFDIAALLYYTDSPANPKQNGPAWSVPNPAQGVPQFGLELDFDELDDFTNFSGLSGTGGPSQQPTSMLALIADWAVSGGARLYGNLPAMARNAVPVYSYIANVNETPTAGEVWIWVKVSTPAPLMD